MESKENITKILLLGETGVGKSSLGNYIIGKEKFVSNGGGNRVTTKIHGEISERELYRDIYIIDSPGTQDTKFEDEKYLEELKNNFNHKNAGVRAICILINFSQPRFASYLQIQIYNYCRLFSIEDFWEHVAFVFTKAFYYIPDEEFNSMKQELESENGLINQLINYIEQCTKNINDEYKKNNTNFQEIRIQNKFPVFFIDSNLKVEDKKNIRTKEEVEKLIQWARNKGYLDLQNIKENHIDVNYLSSERIKDIVLTKKKKKEDSKLKIYIKEFYAHFKKTTFHNEIVYIKEQNPYKIEEIMEEEKISDEIPVSNGKDYKIWKIEHKAVKSKKRVTENGTNKGWEDIENQSDSENYRIISTDNIEEKIIYDKKRIKCQEVDSKTTIEIYKYYKITKIFINDIEQKDMEKKDDLYIETITKKINKFTTEKKDYNEYLKYSDDVEEEIILREYDNGKKREESRNRNSNVRRYWKVSKIEEPAQQNIGNTLYKNVDIFKREDETDINGNIITKGNKKKIGFYTKEYIKTEIREISEVKEITYEEYMREKKERRAEFITNNVVGGATFLGGMISGGAIPFIMGVALMTKSAIDAAKKYHVKIIWEEKREITYDGKTNEIKNEKIISSYIKNKIYY